MTALRCEVEIAAETEQRTGPRPSATRVDPPLF